MRSRFLALAALLATMLVPANAQAAPAPLHHTIDGDTFATGSSYCGSPGNYFTVPSYITIDVVGGTARLAASCSVALSDGAGINFQRVEVKSYDPAGALYVWGHEGATAITMRDSKFGLIFQYSTGGSSFFPSAGATSVVDIARTTFDGPSTGLFLCDRANVGIVESQFLSPSTDLQVLPSTFIAFFYVCETPDVGNSTFTIRNSNFDAHGGAVTFDVGSAPHPGTLIFRDSTVAQGTTWNHYPNPLP